MKPEVVGRLPFILAAQEANDVVVPSLHDTVVLNAGAEADVAVPVADPEIPAAIKELVRGDSVAQPSPSISTDLPACGGAAEALRVWRARKARERSCEGILERGQAYWYCAGNGDMDAGRLCFI